MLLLLLPNGCNGNTGCIQVAQWGADGVIIGSAMVKHLGEADSPREGLKRLEVYARSLKDALSGGSIIGAS